MDSWKIALLTYAGSSLAIGASLAFRAARSKDFRITIDGDKHEGNILTHLVIGTGIGAVLIPTTMVAIPASICLDTYERIKKQFV